MSKLSPNMINLLNRLKVQADAAERWPHNFTPQVEIGLGIVHARTARALAQRGLVVIGKRCTFETVAINDAGRRALEAA